MTREEAIKVLGNTPIAPTDGYSFNDISDALYMAVDALLGRPKGEWIHTPNGIDRDFVWWVCSECGHKIFSETETDRIEFHAYCGRCGAYMRGDTERC